MPPTPVGGDLESWRVEEPVETSQQFFVSNIVLLALVAVHLAETSTGSQPQPQQPSLSSPASPTQPSWTAVAWISLHNLCDGLSIKCTTEWVGMRSQPRC